MIGNIENATFELYLFTNEEICKKKYGYSFKIRDKKIRADDLETYKEKEKEGIFVSHIGHHIIRHQEQKMEFYEYFTKLVWCLMRGISRLHLKDEFYASSYSEVYDGAYLYIDFSNVKQLVKIAYIDTSTSSIPHIRSVRGSYNDYESDNVHDNPAYLSNIDKWLYSIVEKGYPIYTKEYVKKNKIEYPCVYEGLIELPYSVFFGSFFDEIVHYWCIFKRTNNISENWEVLETSKQIVDEMRIKLQNLE